jgi:hypothetical protein
VAFCHGVRFRTAVRAARDSLALARPGFALDLADALAEAPIIKHEENNQKSMFFFGFGLFRLSRNNRCLAAFTGLEPLHATTCA